jgi:hypothetical protein
VTWVREPLVTPTTSPLAGRAPASEVEASHDLGITHVFEVLPRRAVRWPHRVLFGGQHDLVWKTLTAAQELDLAGRLASELAALGVREGDRIVLWLISPQGQHARSERERAGDPSVGFRSGVGRLVASLDAVVVPFGVAGTEHAMPAYLDTFKGTVVAGVPMAWRRGPLAIACGEPLCLGPDEARAAFVSRLEASSLALTRQAEGALPYPDDDRRPWRGCV